MPSIPENIQACLCADAGVRTATGVASAPFPIFVNRAPDAQGPGFVVISEVFGVIDATHNDNSQFVNSLYQISIYHSTYAQAHAIRKAIMAALIAKDATGLASGEKFTLESLRGTYEPSLDTHHLILEVRFMGDPTV